MANLDSLQAHIDTINAEREASGDLFRTAEAEHFFSLYDISTVEAFEEHMDLETYSDWYKERNGFRPGKVTVEFARKQMALWAEWEKLWAEWEKEEQEELAREAEIEAQRWEDATAPAPVNSAMADALRGIL
jgi:hypothetical protein